MNQYITEDQFNEVSIEKQERFYKEIGIDPIHYTAPVIGQMVEFLYKFTTVTIESEERESPNFGWTINGLYSSGDLATALWLCVKDVLKTI